MGSKPDAVGRSGARVLGQTRAVRLVTDADGRVTGVECSSLRGTPPAAWAHRVLHRCSSRPYLYAPKAGRVLHHLKNSVEDPRNLILITGYQAQNTLGRRIVERQPEINIYGQPYRLRAEVDSIGELSGHADQKELIDWLRPIAKGLKKVFLVHGEPDQGAALAQVIQKTYGIETIQATRGDSINL